MVTAQVSKQIHKTFSRQRARKTEYRQIRADKPGYLQLDLMDLVNYYSPKNKGYRYVMVVVDVWSRYCWVRMLKERKGKVLREAFESILHKIPFKVGTLTSDNEFDIKEFHALARLHGFRQYFSEPHEKFRSGIAEAMNKRLRTLLKHYLTENDTEKWIDALQSIVERYNNTKHTSTQRTPQAILGGGAKPSFHDPKFVKEVPQGAWVRVLLSEQVRGKFAKGDRPYYSSNIYKVVGKDKFRYIVENIETGQRLSRPYAVHQLQVIPQTTSRAKPENLDKFRQRKKQMDQTERRLRKDGIPMNKELVEKVIESNSTPPQPQLQPNNIPAAPSTNAATPPTISADPPQAKRKRRRPKRPKPKPPSPEVSTPQLRRSTRAKRKPAYYRP